MCGISGFNWNNKKLIDRMNSLVKHRGPDDTGIFCSEKLTLGHTRLSILDLSKKGKQPFKYSHKGREVIITFNGEIYNFKEIKKKLSEDGFSFRTHSDTEVLCAAYLAYGEKCLEKFNGMWAFALFDKKKQILFCSRDRFGIKPFYYHLTEKDFAFCSEIKGLLPLLKKKEVSEKGLSQFFTFRFSLGEDTLIKGIKKLLPGSCLIYDLSRKRIKNYYPFYHLKTEKRRISFFKAKKEVKNLIEKAVELRMVSDVPVASLLSGGLDSSIITGLAKKRNPKLNTFSIGFRQTNELSYAKIVAKHFKTNHHELNLEEKDVLKFIEEMIGYMDEPIGDPGFLPIFVLSKEVAKKNKVVLSGDGADEIFCGYDRYKLYKYGRKISSFIPPTKNQILQRVRNMKNRNNYLAFLEAIRLFTKSDLNHLGIPEFDARVFWKKESDSLTKAQLFDISTLLPNDFFMKADKMSSAYGVEQRVPFLDYELVEFSLSLPKRYCLRGWKEKFILKKSFKHLLPRSITKRRKHGFNVPIDHWFKGFLGKELQRLLKKSKHSYYNQKFILEILSEIRNKETNHKKNFFLSQKLWSILIFEYWYQKWIQ